MHTRDPAEENGSQMEHQLEFGPETPGEFPVLLTDCSGDTEVNNNTKK